MDAAEFHALAYHVIRQIPEGKVTSYGHIAKLMGMPRHSRHVGQALKFLQPGNDVPWQRVIASSGKISSRGPATQGAQIQKDVLEAEGVEVTTNEMGEFKVSWARFGWFPASVDLEVDAQAQPEGDGEEEPDLANEADEE